MKDTHRSSLAEALLPRQGLFSHRAAPSRRATRQRHGLQMAACVVLISGGIASVPALAVNALLFGLYMTAIWVLGEGLRAEDDYRARAAARAPRLPLKLGAAVLMGAALGLTCLSRGADTVQALLVAGLGAGLHVAAFGWDPRRHKDGLISAASADRVDSFDAAAQADLARITSALTALNDPALTRAALALNTQVTSLLNGLALYPQGIAACRKHLTVFLSALRDASLRHAHLAARAADPARDAAFLDFLHAAEASYKSQADAVTLRSSAALDMEIGVLRDALQREVPRHQ